MAMLSAKKIDFCFMSGCFAVPQDHAPACTENRIIFEQLLDSDLAFQTLCFGDPSDGYVGGFRSTDEALLQNLERKPLLELHSSGTQYSSYGPCRSALFSD